jgi:hypothetical protein
MASKPKKKAGHSRIRIGNVFVVEFDGKRKYFQYVADDLTQLNSRVIRVFKQVYPADAPIELSEIVKGEIEFFAHASVPIGVKLGYWSKVGHVSEVGTVDVYFRDSNDFGNPQIKCSQNWHVWKINEPFVDVGELKGSYQQAEIGVVVAPQMLVHRMRTGSYDFVYPGY